MEDDTDDGRERGAGADAEQIHRLPVVMETQSPQHY